MKKVIISIFALLLVTVASAQWFPQNSGTTKSLYSVCFPSPDTGYTVGDGGTILKTTDGGSNWSSLTSGHNNWYTSVYFIDSNIGYIGGLLYNPRILKTSDGGTNWTSNDAPWGIYSVYFPHQDTGYAVGGDKHYYGLEFCLIMKTTNGGLNWDNIFTDSSYKLRSVFFTDAWTGYAVGHYGRILKTTDGGNNWINQFSGDTTIHFLSVYFPNKDTGYAVGQPGIIYKTTNGGNDWISQAAGTLTPLNSVYFTNPIVGYAVGNDTIIKTTDGGINWTLLDHGNAGDLKSVYFINADTGYIVGENGTILKTTVGGVSPVGIYPEATTSNKSVINPNPSSDIITISLPAITPNNQLIILAVNGQKVIERHLTATETHLNISALPRGVYFVRVQDVTGVQVAKFIKQ